MLTGSWFVVTGVAYLITYFEQGANPAAALNIVPNVPPDLYVQVEWRPDAKDTGRKMDPYTRDDIQSSLMRAWLQLNLSYIRGKPIGLKTYFEGPARAGVEEVIRDAAASGWSFQQVNTRHSLELHFFSADGSIVSLTDHEALVSRAGFDSAGSLVFFADTVESYDMVLFLEDGNWRVRHWVRTSGEVLQNKLDPPLQPPVTPEVVSGGSAAVPSDWRAVDYSRPDPNGAVLWADYDLAQVDRDLMRMRELGIGLVAVSVPYEEFGGPRIDALQRDKLEHFLKRAAVHGLKVLLKLFDDFATYELIHWPKADNHLSELAGYFKDYPALFAWHFSVGERLVQENQNSEIVRAWLRHLSRTLRQADPYHLMGVTWSAETTPHVDPDLGDLILLDVEDFSNATFRLRQVDSTRPVLLVGEHRSSWRSPWFPSLVGEPEQASYLSSLLALAHRRPHTGVIWQTWRDSSQGVRLRGLLSPVSTMFRAKTGLIREDGAPKRAAQVMNAQQPAIESLPRLFRVLTQPFTFTFSVIAALLWCGGSRARRQRTLGALRRFIARVRSPLSRANEPTLSPRPETKVRHQAAPLRSHSEFRKNGKPKPPGHRVRRKRRRR